MGYTPTIIGRRELTNHLLSVVCNMPSVAAGGTSPEYELPTDPAILCSLLRMAIVCASTTFTFAVSDTANAYYPSVDIAYRTTNANLMNDTDMIDAVLNVPNSVMYFNLINTDVGNATGVITVSYLLGK